MDILLVPAVGNKGEGMHYVMLPTMAYAGLGVTLNPILDRNTMRHGLNRNDFEELYGPGEYPKPTAAVTCELVARGFSA